MNKYFVDTNIFLRYLTNDIPDQAQYLEDLMKAAQKGEAQLIIHPFIIAEIVWTLGSFYKYPKKKIDEIISSFVASELFKIDDRDILLQALEDFHTLNIDFIDAFIGNWMIENKVENIATWNIKDFKRIPGINVVEFTMFKQD